VQLWSIFDPFTGSTTKSAKGIEPRAGAAYGRQMANTTVAELAVAIALQEAAAGVFERANDNRGNRIDDYQQSTSGKLGEAWCMKFVYWCFEQTARRLNSKNPMPPLFGAPTFENWARASRKLVTTPALGDVFVKESRHGGLVTGLAIPGGTFPSVEGNTWAKSDFAHRREGVYVLQNEKTLKCTFARLL
jgi:hypothetical protein